MRSGILRMVRGHAQRCPVKVSDESGISAAVANRSYRPPETVMILCVETCDEAVGEASPENRHQPGCIHHVEFVVFGEVAEGAGVLLTRVFGPEQSNFSLFGGAKRAVDFTQDSRLVVVILPLLARERGRSLGLKVGGTGYCVGAHLAEPRCDPRQELRW